MKDNLQGILIGISEFLTRDILKDSIPKRDVVAGVDGRWVRRKSNWRSALSGALLKRFNQINKDMLRKAGYLS